MELKKWKVDKMSKIYYVCKYTPIELLQAFGGECENLNQMPEGFDLADQIAHPNICGFGKAVLEAVMTGKVKELVLVNCCDTIRSVYDILEDSGKLDFLYMIDMLHCDGECSRERTVLQLTVYDCMTNETLYRFFRASLEEIVPFVSSDRSMTERFAADVEERFRNPYLNHQLTSIALNSISKWRARVLPTFRDFFAANGRIPEHLTVGFSCLMHLYRTKYAELKDDAEVLSFFASGKPLKDFLSDRTVWGEDLTAYPQFLETVTAQTERLARGEGLL